MAKVKIQLKSAALISTIKWDDLVKLYRFRPKALFMYDEETGDPVFGVAPVSGRGVVGRNGVEFDQMAGEFAAVEIRIPDCVVDKTGYIQENYGGTLILLNQLEEIIPEVLDELAEEVEAVNACIEEVDVEDAE